MGQDGWHPPCPDSLLDPPMSSVLRAQVYLTTESTRWPTRHFRCIPCRRARTGPPDAVAFSVVVCRLAHSAVPPPSRRTYAFAASHAVVC